VSADAAARACSTRAAPTTGTARTVTCRPAITADDLAAHHAIRHQVFVIEQEVFRGSDRDAHDADPASIHLLGRLGDAPAGAVRLFPLDDLGQLWQGDRLCVLPAFRVHGIGGPLVRCAVAAASARGGARMIAHIQLPNVRFFHHLGWRPQGEVETYAGLAHQQMVIDLPSPQDGARTEHQLFVGIPA
jgi:putative N-acetyltransferase (TIGR04045 family)